MSLLSNEQNTIVDILKIRAYRDGGKTAYVWVDESLNEVEKLSYLSLFKQASSVGYCLNKSGIKKPDNVILLMDSNLGFLKAFYGCLLIGARPIPMKPDIANLAFIATLQSIMDDSSSNSILTTNNILGFLKNCNLKSTKVLDIDDMYTSEESLDHINKITKEDIAYLSYTSGSTGSPKGIKLLHKSLCCHARVVCNAMNVSKKSLLVSWLPLHHVAGLNVISTQSALVGACCILMSPESFLKSPKNWLEAIHKYKGTFSGGPNFAYDLCTKYINIEDVQDVDLSTLDLIFNGSQVIRDDTIKNFTKKFKKIGFNKKAFYQVYGMSECVAIVTGGRSVYLSSPTSPNHTNDSIFSSSLVSSCGKPLLGCDVKIINTSTFDECKNYEVGEIWVSTSSISGGYIKDEYNDVFNCQLANNDKKYLRSGDLGFFDNDNNLFVYGRLREFIIVRGRNIYFNDIETSLRDIHPKLSNAYTSFGVLRDNEEDLIIVIETNEQNIDEKEYKDIIKKIRSVVVNSSGVTPAEIALLKKDAIPRSGVGKFRRNECKKLYCENNIDILYLYKFLSNDENTEYLPSGDKILDIVAQALIKVSGWTDIDINTAINSLGLDSLTATKVISRIRFDTRVELSIADILFSKTVFDIVEKVNELILKTNGGSDTLSSLLDFNKLESRAPTKNFNVSCLQKEILNTERNNIKMFPNENVYFGINIKGTFDAEIFKKSLDITAAQQKQLLCTFSLNNGVFVQNYCTKLSDYVEEYDITNTVDSVNVKENIIKEKVTHFFGLSDHVARVTIIKVGDYEYDVVFVAHHSNFDHWSFGLFLDTVMDSYCKLKLNPNYTLTKLDFEYSDFIEVEQKWLSSKHRKDQIHYWLNKLKGIEPLELKYDYPRTSIQSHKGSLMCFSLDKTKYMLIRSLAENNSATVFMVLISVFKIVLYRYSKHTDIVVGAAIANRDNSKLEKIIGYFSNMLAIRTEIKPSETFIDLLARIKQTTLEAYKNHHIPIEEILRLLRPTSKFDEILPYRVSFLVQNTPQAKLDYDEFKVEFMDLHNGSCNFDIEFNITEVSGKLSVTIEYSNEVFKEKTIKKLWHDYVTILDEILEKNRITIKEASEKLR